MRFFQYLSLERGELTMVANKSLTGNQQSQLTWDRRIPPLESGNRLSWHEFERRYDAMPHLKKAELIEGVVYLPSPLLRIMPNRIVI